MTIFSYSVVMPLYNAEKTVVRALNSIERQKLLPNEVIIVDDCSGDSSVNCIKKFLESSQLNIMLLSNARNSGPSFSRNRGWEAATGDYLFFLDSDDQWCEEKIASIMGPIIENPECKMFYHYYSIESRSCGRESVEEDVVGTSAFLFRNPAQTSCVAVRKELDLRFRQDMSYCEDHDLWLRISEIEPICRVKSVLTVLGRAQGSEGGLSSDLLKMRLGELQVLYGFSKRNSWFFLFYPLFVVFLTLKHFVRVARVLR